MKKFIRFSEIGQFRNTIRDVNHTAKFVGLDENNDPIYKPNAKLPIVSFSGTVKLHGTCSSFCTDENEIWFQSRKRILTPEHDNYDFSLFCNSRIEILKNLLNKAKSLNNVNGGTISIFGEYCGQGIQSGVGISQLPKMLVIFAVKLTNGENSIYLNPKNLSSPEHRIYNIYDFQTFSIDIDFSYPKVAQNKMVEFVEEVEKHCPVAKALGVTTGNVTGEGIVWIGNYKDQRFVFKTKGEKHSISKVKTLKSVDVEKVNSVMEFVEYAVTENRMNQAVEELFISQNKEPTIKGMGDFLRWVVHDIAKEELDVLTKNYLTVKDVSKSISNKARPWFQELLDKNVGL